MHQQLASDTRVATSGNRGIRLDMAPAPISESDVQAQISHLAQQAQYLTVTVNELTARLGPLLFPAMAKNTPSDEDVMAARVPAGTQVAQHISELAEQVAQATRQLHDIQRRLGI